MSKQLVFALVLIALVVVLLLINTGGRSLSVNFGLFEIKRISQSVAFFSFTLVGVIIGLLLK